MLKLELKQILNSELIRVLLKQVGAFLINKTNSIR